MYVKYKAVKKTTSGIASFFSGRWIWLIGLFLAYPFIVAYMRRQEAKDKIRASKDELKNLEAIKNDPKLLQEALDLVADRDLQIIAKAVYHHLGYAYSWYDPRRWTENDKEVYDLLKNFNPIPFELTEAYFVISTGRHLHDDLAKVLDPKYYKLLIW